jgi:uncharacterized integral membrane protein
MTAFAWILSAALLLLTIFAVANWTLLTASASLNFLLFSVEGPLGLILFAALLGFAAVFAVYAMSLRTRALLEARRHLKDLEVQRQLAESAEASRLAALTEKVGREFESVRVEIAQIRADAKQRADDSEQRIIRHLDDVSNALFANVGQLDEKLSRNMPVGGR